MQFGQIFAVMQSERGQMEAKIVPAIKLICISCCSTQAMYLDILLQRRTLSFNDLRQLRVFY